MGWCATKDRFRFTPFSKLLNFPRDTHLAQDLNLPNGQMAVSYVKKLEIN